MLISKYIFPTFIFIFIFYSCRSKNNPSIIGKWENQFGVKFTFNKDSSYFTEKDGNRMPPKEFNFRFKSNGKDELYLIALEDAPPVIVKILLFRYDTLHLKDSRNGTVYYLRRIN